MHTVVAKRRPPTNLMAPSSSAHQETSRTSVGRISALLLLVKLVTLKARAGQKGVRGRAQALLARGVYHCNIKSGAAGCCCVPCEFLFRNFYWALGYKLSFHRNETIALSAQHNVQNQGSVVLLCPFWGQLYKHCPLWQGNLERTQQRDAVPNRNFVLVCLYCIFCPVCTI